MLISASSDEFPTSAWPSLAAVRTLENKTASDYYTAKNLRVDVNSGHSESHGQNSSNFAYSMLVSCASLVWR